MQGYLPKANTIHELSHTDQNEIQEKLSKNCQLLLCLSYLQAHGVGLD